MKGYLPLTPAEVTRFQAPGAYIQGTPVIKQNSESDDAHPNGSRGTIRGSVGPATVPKSEGGDGKSHIGYFVEWSDMKGLVVFTLDHKVKAVQQNEVH